SRCRLRVLDVTGLPDDSSSSSSGRSPDGVTVWSGTVALAKACLDLSKDHRESQKSCPKRHKGRSGTATP
ncbi:LRC14 protein, partial [Xiphorhynchus elegans]|nr:LRC14 protein [Xiphorhynchus elegans]